VVGAYSCFRESRGKERIEKVSTTMKAKANLFRTLVVLAMGLLVAMAVALFGVGLRTAESQTTTTPKMQVQDLGTLGGSSSHAMGINDSGKVVGYSFTSDGAQHAFLYDASATPKMLDLGTLGGNYSRALGINNSGKVVGWSYTNSGEKHAFLYDSTNGMQDLNDLIPANSGSTIEEAAAINTDGKIAATDFKPLDMDPNFCGQEDQVWGMYMVAVLTPTTTATPATYEVQDLGTLGADNSGATGINDSGQVAGTSWNSSCSDHAFLYDENATPKMLDLGTLGGDYSEATSINDSGQVVGDGVLVGSHAFLYDSATQKMQDLGDLEGGNLSQAMGINDSGQVVGRSYVGSASYVSGSGRAFLYDSTNGMQDLNNLIPADSGWTIYVASAINSKGKIAATGYKEGVGQHALLLTPTSSDSQAPSPPTIASPQNNSYDSDGSFSVSGSAEAASTVELFEGTTSRGTTKADSSSGAWSIPLSGASEGAHTYTVKATDAAGNTSSASNSVTITVDKTPPTVSRVSPANGATNVGRNTSVTADFSERMDPATLTKSTVTLVKSGTTTLISATVSYNDSTKMITLKPSSNLAARTKYTAKLTGGVKDLAGNALSNAPYTWNFTTGR
jgi:probable HAF family extracellular repeat protein